MQIYAIAFGTDRWLALEPLCEELGLDFEKETYLLKADDFYKKEIQVREIDVSDAIRVKMLGITFKGFIPWIFSKEKELGSELTNKAYLGIYSFFKDKENEYIEVMTKREELLQQKIKVEELLLKMQETLILEYEEYIKNRP